MGVVILSSRLCRPDYNIMFKSILKCQRKGRETKPRVTLRVSFSFDEQSTQEEVNSTQQELKTTQSMSWEIQPSQSGQPQTQEQALEESQAKMEDSLLGCDEFKAEDIKWNGFILVYNTKCTLTTFHCGKCEQSFQRVNDFCFHCLAECNEISHSNSSHFIFDEEDWQKFINKQEKKPSQQAQPPKNDTRRDVFKSRMKPILDFTKKTLDFWRETAMEQTFIPEQHYIYECGLVMLLNPIHEDYASAHLRMGKRKCPLYKLSPGEGQRQRFMNRHFNQECCQLNNHQSSFLLLDADLFYEYLFEKGKGFEEMKEDSMDLPYLLYLYDHTELKSKVQAKYPKITILRPYIQLYFKMPSMVPQSSYFQPGLKAKKGSFSEFSCTYLDIYYKKKKAFRLASYRGYLESSTLYCPCQNFATPMTAQQFLAHLKNRKERHHINIADHLFSPK